MLKQPNVFYSRPSTLPKDAPVKFNLSTTFELSFMISSVALTRSSTFYAYLVTKIGNRNHNITKSEIAQLEKLSLRLWSFEESSHCHVLSSTFRVFFFVI